MIEDTLKVHKLPVICYSLKYEVNDKNSTKVKISIVDPFIGNSIHSALKIIFKVK